MIRTEVYVLEEVHWFLEGHSVDCVRIVKMMSFVDAWPYLESRWRMGSVGV